MSAEPIAAKLTRPRLRDGVIARPRVLDRLDRFALVPVLLVSAPAGYGKTVAVDAWLRRGERVVAWVTLDAADNDPVRLWRHVAAAFRGAPAPLNADTLHAAIDALARRLAADARPWVLVLDDVHTVETLDSLAHALGVLPRNVQVVLITRADPKLRLARMRAHGALAEIRAHDLAFMEDEAERLLIGAEGLDLSPGQVRELTARTEGWAAGLQLAALRLRDAGDVDAALAGARTHVAEYLAAEALDGLDPDLRSFLQRTAVLPRFSAALCDHVLEREDSEARIAQLVRANLFVSGADGWFRYHDLFREHLLAQLEPEAAIALHRRAAAWFEARGRAEQATEHRLAAGDHALVAESIERFHAGLVRSGLARTLLRWLDSLPEPLLRERPGLATTAAVLASAVVRPSLEVRRRVALARQARDEHPDRWLPDHEASLSLVVAAHTDDDVAAAIAAAKGSVALAEGAGSELSVIGNAVLSCLLHLAGDATGATAAARRALEHPAATRRPYGLVTALATLAIVTVERGRVERGRALAQQALEATRDAGIEDGAPGARAHIADAVVAQAEGRLAEAERAAGRTLELRAGMDDSFLQAWMVLVLASIRVDRGRLTQAQAALDEARAMLAGCRDAGTVGEFADVVAERLKDARCGDLTRPLAEPPSPAEMAVLMLLPTPRTARDIAESLYLSTHTVKSHTRSIYRKLGVSSREEAVARATALGLIDTPV